LGDSADARLAGGLHGLAAGVGLFATLTIFTAALLQDNQPLAYATLPLAGCLLGFLCFNFNPATVFLGDCGSLLIGFLLGCFGVIWAQKSVTLLGITAPLMAMSVPLLDVLLCIVRRWLRNQPIFGADRGHIHHRLLDRGLSPRQSVFILYSLSSLAAIFSLVQGFANNIYIAAVVVVLFLAIVWTAVHHLGYAEFMFASRLLRLAELQRGVTASMSLSSLERTLKQARTPGECWAAISGMLDTFGFAGARMRLGGMVFENWSASLDSPPYWLMRIPLSTRGDYLEFARELNSPVLPMVVVPFIDLVSALLPAALEASSELQDQATIAVPAGN
jgi:UDP-GlcNAc:undecaprenyl-phosphate/decaprenyl-phosphate GlcNAc-1-phosphate transferase